MAKKTRAYRRWAIDCDYLHKLPPKERKWMENFLDEYYREDHNKKDRIHPPELKTKCHSSNNAAERDMWTAHPKQVIERHDRVQRMDEKNRAKVYFMQDYLKETTNPEKNLVDSIDNGTTQKLVG